MTPKKLSPERLACILPATGPLVLSVGERAEILNHIEALEAELEEANACIRRFADLGSKLSASRIECERLRETWELHRTVCGS